MVRVQMTIGPGVVLAGAAVEVAGEVVEHVDEDADEGGRTQVMRMRMKRPAKRGQPNHPSIIQREPRITTSSLLSWESPLHSIGVLVADMLGRPSRASSRMWPLRRSFPSWQMALV
jgi:hypothetical protein